MAPQAAVKWADVLVAVNEKLVAGAERLMDALHQSVIGMPNEVKEMTDATLSMMRDHLDQARAIQAEIQAAWASGGPGGEPNA